MFFSKNQAFPKVSGYHGFPAAFPCMAPANSFFIDNIPGLVSPVRRRGFVVLQMSVGNADVLEDACLLRKPVVSYVLPCLSGLASWLKSA